MAPVWTIQIFGELQVQRQEPGGDASSFPRFRTSKTALLLAYLALHLDRPPVPRQTLVDLFWPDCRPPAGRNNLSRELAWLRHQLEPSHTATGPVLVADRASVGLNRDAVTTDVIRFETALRAAARATSQAARVEQLTAAVELYRGELLAGFYESWVLEPREWLAESYFQGLRQLLRLLETVDELSRGLEYARRGVRLDPLREDSHQDLMRIYAAMGQPEAALRHYREFERLLDAELAAEPSAPIRALAREIERAVRAPVAPARTARGAAAPLIRPLESLDGAVPLGSAFYVARPADAEFHAAVAQGESLVLVKGARQMGKTSLLARGLQRAREAGARVVTTDLQRFGRAQLASLDAFYLVLAQWLAEQLNVAVQPQECWRAGGDPGINFERYLLRELLERSPAPLVWGLDGVDRLLSCDFGSEVFGLFRSWHNARSFDATGLWQRLTLAMAYATEAHLLIPDASQSPFNVGTRLVLGDFTFAEVADLSRRYGSPIPDPIRMMRFYQWVGGHPYLVRRGLHEMTTRGIDLAELERQADSDAGPFADHLRQIVTSLARDSELTDTVRRILRGRSCASLSHFYRLRSAGLIVGESMGEARPRCRLYAAYLERRLR
jgi:DNA-binding SARP family transcriptional activator